MLLFALSGLLLISFVSSHSSYMDDIPNGHKVPNPKSPGSYWEAVGHTVPDDGDGLNPFGRDYKSAKKEWTTQLCQMDSDGDGKTNGVELGDPHCTWRPGSTPTGPATGHPGYRDTTSGQGSFTGMTFPPMEHTTEESKHHHSHEEHHECHEHEHECKEEHHSHEKDHEKHHSHEKDHEKHHSHEEEEY